MRKQRYVGRHRPSTAPRGQLAVSIAVLRCHPSVRELGRNQDRYIRSLMALRVRYPLPTSPEHTPSER